MKRFPLPAVLTLGLLLACAVPAGAQLYTWDQQDLGPSDSSSELGVTSGNAFGQSFVPTAASLNAVAFKISGVPNADQSATTTLHAVIHDGAGLSGTVLGTSDPVTVGVNFGTGANGPNAFFTFPTPVSVAPGSSYTAVLELVSATGGAHVNVSGTLGSTYAQGQGYPVNTETDFLFREGTASTLTDLYDFSATDANHDNPDGASPQAGLIQASDGKFYGLAANGGTNSFGTAFSLTTGGTFSGLHSFSGLGEGSDPEAALLEGNDGNFYGVTRFSGGNGAGTVFQLTPAGELRVVHTFTGGDDGATPQGALILGSDGSFYGTTSAAGNGGGGSGTVFKINAQGVLTTLHTFTTVDGSDPQAGLIQASDGNFYGTTATGGTNGKGIIFNMTPAGVVTTRYTFDPATTPTDGATPNGLLQGSDGNFYGTTQTGGLNGFGTIFRLSANGTTLTTLHSFANAADGTVPHATLIEGSDGNFYGTAANYPSGGSRAGTVYQLSRDGKTVTTLYDFTTASTAFGAYPVGGLVQGSDGNLYGTASEGGAHGNGSLYRVNVQLPNVVQFHALTNTAFETDGQAMVRVDRIGGADALTVDYTTADGTGASPAVSGQDYVAASGTLSWAAGDQTPKFIPVFITNQHQINGGLRTFSIVLGSIGTDSADQQTLGYPSTAAVTINESPGAPPVVTSEAASATQGSTFSYQIAATNNPQSYGAGALPSGLSVNTATGVISGTPRFPGTYKVDLSATNVLGTGTGTLTLQVAGTVPAITSAATASGQVGQPFSYLITATNSPTGFSASSLPAGLSVDAASGLISGTPTVAGTFTTPEVTATNDTGSGSQMVTITIAAPPAPVITSDLNPPSRVGVSFAYQITATGTPVNYSAKGLPGGLTLGSTGRITGKPAAVGTFVVQIGAFDASGGQGTAQLHLVVKPAAPVITSNLNPPSAQGVAFGYSIVATNSPSLYGASGFPTGLSINQSTGRISGTPQVFGLFNVTIAAFNSGGSTSTTLVLNVKQSGPVITSPLTATATAGQAFSYQITAKYGPQSFGASGLPAGLTFNPATGLISGTPLKAGPAVITIAAFNSVNRIPPNSR